MSDSSSSFLASSFLCHLVLFYNIKALFTFKIVYCYNRKLSNKLKAIKIYNYKQKMALVKLEIGTEVVDIYIRTVRDIFSNRRKGERLGTM